MARSDLLVSLVRAGLQRDPLQFRRIVEALAAEERAKQHGILADRLEELVNQNGHSLFRSAGNGDDQLQSLIYELIPRRTLDDLVLTDAVRLACQELIEEHQRAELLRSYGLEPRHRVLLVGPPGNGKTSLGEALAESLMLPFMVVRYEGVIGSYLGETAQRLRRVFDHVRTRHCVLFLDEFDTIGKERGDAHETGEIKRVVSSLLLQMDALPSHVVVITATNHPELLDRAVWRRFELRLDLLPPTKLQIGEWIGRFEKKMDLQLGIRHDSLADKLKGLSFAEIEDFGTDVMRRYLLQAPSGNPKAIVEERLRQWRNRLRSPSFDSAKGDEPCQKDLC